MRLEMTKKTVLSQEGRGRETPPESTAVHTRGPELLHEQGSDADDGEGKQS